MATGTKPAVSRPPQSKPPEPAPAAEPPKPHRRGRSLVLRAMALGGVLVAIAAASWFLVPRLLHGRGTAVAPVQRATVSLAPIFVNVAGEGRRYVRVAVSVGVPGPHDAKEVEAARPQVLDLLISVLASAPVQTLSTEPGRVELKKTLLDRMHAELGLHKIVQIYFTEFVIQ